MGEKLGKLAQGWDANTGSRAPCPNFQPKFFYLDLKLVALSTTYTTKLPPVLAHPVYHPHVKAKPFGCSASLRSLDMGWCVEPGPHRKGTRSRRGGRRLTEKQGGKLTSSRRGTWGPLRRLQLTCSELIIHFFCCFQTGTKRHLHIVAVFTDPLGVKDV